MPRLIDALYGTITHILAEKTQLDFQRFSELSFRRREF